MHNKHLVRITLTLFLLLFGIVDWTYRRFDNESANFIVLVICGCLFYIYKNRNRFG